MKFNNTKNKGNIDSSEDKFLDRNRFAKKKAAKRVVHGTFILLIITILFFLFLGYHYVQKSLQPLNPYSNKKIEVNIPNGSTSKKIGSILEKNKIIRNGFVFDYYVKSKRLGGFKAGYYYFTPSMTLNEIANKLEEGGSSLPINSDKILIKEGVTINNIGDVIQKNTKFTKKDFLNLMTNKQFIHNLYIKYPNLLSSAIRAKNVKYTLEGYLYPATYTLSKNETLPQLVEMMVMKENQELSPYFQQISERHMTVQQILTLASLVEGEAPTVKNQSIIAGVFENRLDNHMKLQSDVSISYILGKHKKDISYKDLNINSPYNLYKNYGIGPGPYNNPPITAVEACLNPSERNKGYLYFVANMKTGNIYFSKTYAQHEKNVIKVQKDNGYSK